MQEQFKILQAIIKKNKNCEYGQKYDFANIKNYTDRKTKVPTVTIEELLPDIKRAMKWEENILCTEKIRYFARTSGTTSWVNKHLPVTKTSLKKNHIQGQKEQFKKYIKNNPKHIATHAIGKMIVIWGGFFENQRTQKNNIGHISAILQKECGPIKRLKKEPKENITYIHDREKKINLMLPDILDKEISAIGGVTNRIALFLEKILEETGAKNILEVRPKFKRVISWGIAFEPYRKSFERFFPNEEVKFYQTYNASEGIFGIQVKNNNNQLELLTDHWVFYEFIDMDTFGSENQKICNIEDIEENKNYGLVITTYGGLYRYIIGDTIIFNDKKRMLFDITGRTKLCITTFREDIIINNTDNAIKNTCQQHNVEIKDYTVGPQIFEGQRRWRHERIISCINKPKNKEGFIKTLDQELKKQNEYYKLKRKNDLLITMPKVHFVEKNFFEKNWFEKKGKMWAQHKLPRLQNNRKLLEELLPFIQKD